jgi:hypothetical protein
MQFYGVKIGSIIKQTFNTRALAEQYIQQHQQFLTEAVAIVVVDQSGHELLLG